MLIQEHNHGTSFLPFMKNVDILPLKNVTKHWSETQTLKITRGVHLIRFHLTLTPHMTSFIVKGHLDDLYNVIGRDSSHITLYQEWHGDGSAINSGGKPAWEIYLTY